jgi:DNA-binding MarR family transcriptional regulator
LRRCGRVRLRTGWSAGPGGAWADFKVIRDQLGLSDSALSKQLSTLEQAEYVQIRKAFVGKRPRTSARLTGTGLAAFQQHVAALQQIVGRSGVTVLPG